MYLVRLPPRTEAILPIGSGFMMASIVVEQSTEYSVQCKVYSVYVLVHSVQYQV